MKLFRHPSLSVYVGGRLRPWRFSPLSSVLPRHLPFYHPAKSGPVAPCALSFHQFSTLSILPLTEIIRAERLQVRDVSTNSAALHWRPVLSGLTGYYEIRFGPLPTGGGGVGGSGTSPSTGGSQYQRLTKSADSSNAILTGLMPDTTYTASLIPESNEHAFNTLSVTFTTKPGWCTSYLHVLSYSRMMCLHAPFFHPLLR